MQEHHRKEQPEKSNFLHDDLMSEIPASPRQEVVQAAQLAVQARKQKATSTLERNKDKHRAFPPPNESSPINVHPPTSFPSSVDGGLFFYSPNIPLDISLHLISLFQEVT